ncbi:MAG TPA: CcmD family protein [Terriglobia bacterium]|nr:CcmD family protein [Terriglobia bacterium]
MNTYLFLAYSIVWVIFVAYAWTLSRRHARLKKELEDLKTRINKSPKP